MNRYLVFVVIPFINFVVKVQCSSERQMAFSMDQAGHLFVKSFEKMTFVEGQSFCRSLGGELPSVRTKRESKFLMRTSHPVNRTLPCFGPWLSSNQSNSSSSPSSDSCKSSCCAFQLCNKNKFMSMDCNLKRTVICNITRDASSGIPVNGLATVIQDSDDDDNSSPVSLALKESGKTFTISEIFKNPIITIGMIALTICILIIGIVLAVNTLLRKKAPRRSRTQAVQPFEFSETLIYSRE